MVFFPDIGPGVVVRHIALIGRDLKAECALGGMIYIVLVHLGKNKHRIFQDLGRRGSFHRDRIGYSSPRHRFRRLQV